MQKWEREIKKKKGWRVFTLVLFALWNLKYQTTKLQGRGRSLGKYCHLIGGKHRKKDGPSTVVKKRGGGGQLILIVLFAGVPSGVPS
jgi:hypothetical protein